MITSFQALAATAAIKSMFADKRFSVCQFDTVAELVGKRHVCAGVDYAALRAVHYIEWATMGPELSEQVKAKCLELLGITEPPEFKALVPRKG